MILKHRGICTDVSFDFGTSVLCFTQCFCPSILNRPIGSTRVAEDLLVSVAASAYVQIPAVRQVGQVRVEYEYLMN